MVSKMRFPFQKSGQEWLTIFQNNDLVKNLIEDNKTLSNLIKENKTLIISPFLHNFIEEIHTKIEKTGKKYLDLILKENLSFLDSPNDFYEFISFLSTQLTRWYSQRSRPSRSNQRKNNRRSRYRCSNPRTTRLIAPLPLYFELPQFYLNTPHRLDWTLHHKKSMEPSPRKYREL